MRTPLGLLGLSLLGCMAPADSSSTESTIPATSDTSRIPARPAELQEQVDSCAAYVGLKADLGDVMWTQLEDNMTSAEGGIDVWCEQLAINDPAGLAAMQEEFESITYFLAQAAAASSTTLPPTAPRPDPTLVRTCVQVMNWRVLTGEASAVRMWNDSGQSSSALQATCEQFVLSDPAAAALLVDELATIRRLVSAPPLTTAPPPQPTAGTGCDPNYSGCVPIASDVDCASGSGNGPAYTNGPVAVIGQDIYDLDRDGDGWGCE